MEALLAELDVTVADCAGSDRVELKVIAEALQGALAELRETTALLLEQLADNREAALAGAFDYMMQVGYVMGGWHLARSALVADARLRDGADNPFYPRKLASARFYVENLLPRALGCAQVIRNGSAALLDYAEDWL
jgi:hypothetical protein